MSPAFGEVGLGGPVALTNSYALLRSASTLGK